MLGKPVFHVQKNKIEPCTIHKKINSKWIKDLSVRLLKENKGEKVLLSKESNQQNKTLTYGLGKNICEPYI
jgi:hypothetical protein